MAPQRLERQLRSCVLSGRETNPDAGLDAEIFSRHFPFLISLSS